MDLWERLAMSERITKLWQELGISVGTAMVVLVMVNGSQPLFGGISEFLHSR